MLTYIYPCVKHDYFPERHAFRHINCMNVFIHALKFTNCQLKNMVCLKKWTSTRMNAMFEKNAMFHQNIFVYKSLKYFSVEESLFVFVISSFCLSFQSYFKTLVKCKRRGFREVSKTVNFWTLNHLQSYYLLLSIFRSTLTFPDLNKHKTYEFW